MNFLWNSRLNISNNYPLRLDKCQIVWVDNKNEFVVLD